MNPLAPFQNLFSSIAGQDPTEAASGVANILDRGSVGVAALAIIGLVGLFWLYVRQARYYDTRLDSVRSENRDEFKKLRDEQTELQKDTTSFLKDVAHAMQEMVRSLDKRDLKAEEILRTDQEVLRKVDKILDRTSSNNHVGGQ